MTAAARSARRARRAWFRHGFTTRASCLFAAGVTAVLCGLALGEVNLLRAGVLAAVVPWVAAGAVARAKLRIGVRRSVEPARVEAGQPITASLTVANGSPLPTAVLLLEDRLPERVSGRARFVLPSLRRHEEHTVSYRVPALSRGRHRIGPLQVRLGDPFGLIEVTRAFTATSEVVVAPAVERLGSAGVPQSVDRDGATAGQGLGIHGADDASTREYRVGDDLRKIHWRSTARTGMTMVRQEEQLWQRRSAVLLDLRALAHAETGESGVDVRLSSSLEWAVSAAASLGSAALHNGRRFVLAADPAARRGTPFTDLDSLLLELAAVHPQGPGSPADLLRGLYAAGEAATTIAVLGRLDAVTLTELTAASPRGPQSAPFALVLDVDSWSAAAPETPGTPKPLPAADASAVLYDAGWHPTVVRRGDSVADAWQAVLSGASNLAARREVHL